MPLPIWEIQNLQIPNFLYQIIQIISKTQFFSLTKIAILFIKLLISPISLQQEQKVGVYLIYVENPIKD